VEARFGIGSEARPLRHDRVSDETGEMAYSFAPASRLRLHCLTVIQREEAVVEHRLVLPFHEAAQLRETLAEILVGAPGGAGELGHVVVRGDCDEARRRTRQLVHELLAPGMRRPGSAQAAVGHKTGGQLPVR
jgi:hypothetical protein